MPPARTQKRHHWRKAARCLATGLVLLGSLPVWLPWMARPVLRKYGVEFDRWERQGYTRFTLTEVEFQQPATRFSAARVDTTLSLPDLSAHVRIDNWKFTTGQTPTGRGNDSTFVVFEHLESMLPPLRQRLPAVVLSNGTVRANSTTVGIPELAWQHGRLRARLEWPEPRQTIVIVGDFSGAAPHAVTVQVAPLTLEISAQLRRAPGAWTVAGAAAACSDRTRCSTTCDRNPLRGRWGETSGAFVVSHGALAEWRRPRVDHARTALRPETTRGCVPDYEPLERSTSCHDLPKP